MGLVIESGREGHVRESRDAFVEQATGTLKPEAKHEGVWGDTCCRLEETRELKR